MTNSLSRRHVLRSTVAFSAMGCLPLSARAASETLRVGVIGHTGRGDYGHGIDKVWMNVADTSIVAASDPVDEGRARAIDRLQLAPEAGYSSYRTMLTEAKPDIVAIGPRHIDQHCDMAVAAAESGAKGIYMEKPFCRDLKEADAIVAACEKNNTKLAIAHRNRYHPVLPVVQKLVEKEEIGRLLEIRARGKEDTRGGSLDLWVLGSHLLNLAHYFSGDPKSCCASIFQEGRLVTRTDVIDGSEGVGPLAGNEVHARFETESEIPLFFDSIQNAGTREAGFGLQLVGTKGIIDFRADREPLAHILPGSPFQPSAKEQSWLPITSAGINKPEPIEDIGKLVGSHLAAVHDLIAAIREDRDPLCSAKDGRTVVEMTMAAFASHVTGGQRVAIPLVERSNPLANW